MKVQKYIKKGVRFAESAQNSQNLQFGLVMLSSEDTIFVRR